MNSAVRILCDTDGQHEVAFLEDRVDVVLLGVLAPQVHVGVDLSGDGGIRGAVTAHVPGPLKNRTKISSAP